MRQARFKPKDVCTIYHCTSSIVGNQRLIQNEEKRFLHTLIHGVAIFSGIEVITYSIMQSHFHVEAHVRPPEPISNEELLRRVETLYGKNSTQSRQLRKDFEQHGQIAPRLREPYLKQMNDISSFMQKIKQRFSRWYNRQNNRSGYLWGQRFHSVVVPPRSKHALRIAIYDDLNAFRAGIVQDPKDYPYCGYAEALAGNESIRANMIKYLEVGRDWEEVSRSYRVLLFLEAGIPHHSDKAAMDPERIQQVLDECGELPMADRTSLPEKYFTHGGVLGPKPFVAEMAQRCGRPANKGPCQIKEAGWEDSATLWQVRGPLC